MKKFLSLLLVAAMVLCLGVTAFADTTPAYSITVNAPANTSVSIDGNTYSAYKLFDVTYSGDAYAYTISEGSQFYKDADALAVIQDYFTLKLSTTSGVYNVTPKAGYKDNARAFADAIQASLTGKTADGTATAANRSAVIELTKPGYYIVDGSATAPGSNTVAAAIALTNADPDGEVFAKVDAPSIDKFIVNADAADVKATSQDVGSDVSFKLTSKVPVMTGYSSYTYVVNEIMTEGLTFNNDVAVTIGDTAFTGFTVSDVNNGAFTITFADMINQTAGAEIVITYSAKINDAALENAFETNTASLTYSSDPYSATTKTSPVSEVYVYDFDIVIDKYTGEYSANTKLAGAKFVLLNDEGKYYKWDETNKAVVWVEAIADADVKITDGNGYALFKGLEAGTYALHETEAPTGYNILEADVPVTITPDYNADGTMTEDCTATSTSGGQYAQTASVVNNTGAVLPETGGIGTTMFYVFGGLLVVAAAVLLITKKRMANEA